MSLMTWRRSLGQRSWKRNDVIEILWTLFNLIYKLQIQLTVQLCISVSCISFTYNSACFVCSVLRRNTSTCCWACTKDFVRTLCFISAITPALWKCSTRLCQICSKLVVVSAQSIIRVKLLLIYVIITVDNDEKIIVNFPKVNDQFISFKLFTVNFTKTS